MRDRRRLLMGQACRLAGQDSVPHSALPGGAGTVPTLCGAAPGASVEPQATARDLPDLAARALVGGLFMRSPTGSVSISSTPTAS
jgi:hypothetical protein